MKNLNNYHVPKGEKIEFDEYGRPYVQHKSGKLMLSRKKEYNYTIKN